MRKRISKLKYCSFEKKFCGNGKYADLAVFSFHPVKHIACGEGGMVTTNSKELYDKLKLLRTHGITKNDLELYDYAKELFYADLALENLI